MAVITKGLQQTALTRSATTALQIVTLSKTWPETSNRLAKMGEEKNVLNSIYIQIIYIIQACFMAL